jgi:hypothetical protein
MTVNVDEQNYRMEQRYNLPSRIGPWWNRMQPRSELKEPPMLRSALFNGTPSPGYWQRFAGITRAMRDRKFRKDFT